MLKSVQYKSEINYLRLLGSRTNFLGRNMEGIQKKKTGGLALPLCQKEKKYIKKKSCYM